MEISATTSAHEDVLMANADHMTVSVHAFQAFTATSVKTVLLTDMAILVSTLAQQVAKEDNAILRQETANANSGLSVRNVNYVHRAFMAICADFNARQDA